MLFWMAGPRLPAAKRMGIDIGQKPGGRGPDFDSQVPENVAWKSHNYTHLMEQPTLFYAASVIIALLGASALDTVFAWIYVALRIVHSIWQATVNVVKIRFLLFIASTIALIYLAYRALALTLFHDPSLVLA